MGLWCVQGRHGEGGRYDCDPHQQWADEGWGEERLHACNERCDYFTGCEFDTSVGICLRDSHIRHHGNSQLVSADIQWVEYVEDDRAGDCVW